MPKFQQRHYEAIADVMEQNRPDDQHGLDLHDRLVTARVWQHIVDDLVTALHTDNPKFNPTKFRERCNG